LSAFLNKSQPSEKTIQDNLICFFFMQFSGHSKDYSGARIYRPSFSRKQAQNARFHLIENERFGWF
jgi:hypothetical protein